jgi:hypothetical protein
MKEKAQFVIALRRYLNIHLFYSPDEVTMLKNDSLVSSAITNGFSVTFGYYV